MTLIVYHQSPMSERLTAAGLILKCVDAGDHAEPPAWPIGESRTSKEIKRMFPEVSGRVEAIPKDIFVRTKCFLVGTSEWRGREILNYKRDKGPSDETCEFCPFSEKGESPIKCAIQKSYLESK